MYNEVQRERLKKNALIYERLLPDPIEQYVLQLKLL
jgi:hypothetical protein